MPAKTTKLWRNLWLIWAFFGVGTALAIITATELGWNSPPWIWWAWAVPGVLYGGAVELAAVFNTQTGDSLSEHIIEMDDGGRSFVVAFVLWVAWFLASGSAWPSAGIVFCLWCAVHFWTWRRGQGDIVTQIAVPEGVPPGD